MKKPRREAYPDKKDVLGPIIYCLIAIQQRKNEFKSKKEAETRDLCAAVKATRKSFFRLTWSLCIIKIHFLTENAVKESDQYFYSS